MDNENHNQPVSVNLYDEIQRFLFGEAALLDQTAYLEWFSLLTDDITYRVFTRLVVEGEGGIQEHGIIDEGKDHLELRVRQLADPKLTRAENPPSFHRRFVSNIRADHGEQTDSFIIRANILVYKHRPSNNDIIFYVGKRRDLLRRVDQKLCIALREVHLDQSVFVGGALSTLL